MTTRKMLWLGFGILLGILTLTLLGVTIWVRELRSNLEVVRERVEPEMSAAYEMHVSGVNTALALLNYVHSGAAGYRDRVIKEMTRFREQHTRYSKLAVKEDELAQQVGAVYEEFVAAGSRLLASSDQLREVQGTISRGMVEMFERLDQQIESTKPQTTWRRALRNMQISLAEVGTWLGSYLRTGDDDDRQRLMDAEQRFSAAWATYENLDLKPQEEQWLAELRPQAQALVSSVNQATTLYDDEAVELQEIAHLQLRLDVLLEQGVQTLAKEDLDAAGKAASAAIDRILLSTIVLLVAGVLLSSVTSIVVSRGIVRAEQTLRVTLASIGDAVIATDASGRITFMNRVAESLTGWSQPEAIARPLGDVFSLIDESTRQPLATRVTEVLQLDLVVGLASKALLVGRDGKERAVDDSLAPIHDDQGRVSGVVLVFRDATERRNEEHQLKEADRRKNEFLAMLSHELRNPLAPLRNALYVLQSTEIDGDQRNRMLEMMVRQVQSLTRMIDDLLDVARVTSGKIELRRQTLDLADLTTRVTDVARAEFEGGNRQLVVDVPAEPVLVNVDPTRVEQVISNLLNNAFKCTQAGGHVWVDLDVDGDGEGAVLRVRDDGIGISAENLDEVFGLFAQVDTNRARSQGGLGIGLTLVRDLAQMHGGTVQALSPGLGHGSEFVVRLPRVSQPRAAAANAGVAPDPAPPQSRILVVDDNVDSADSLALLLRLRGHDAHAAHHGRDALEIARSLRPQLVLLDIGLPEIDGYEIATRLRSTAGFETTVLVAMTGYGQPEDIVRSREAGFHHHLVKPVDIDTLQNILRPENLAAAVENGGSTTSV